MQMVRIFCLTALVAVLNSNVAWSAPPQSVTLAVENMTCGTCPIVVKKALQRVPGVSAVVVDFEHKTATVTFDQGKATTAELTKATTDAGFPSKLILKP